MSNIKVESTTDSVEAVAAANASELANTDNADENKKSVSEQGENSEESETSQENEEGDTEEDDTEEGDTEEGEEDDGKKPEGKKRRSGFQRRIKRLQRDRSMAEREADYWRNEAKRLQQSQKPAEQESVQPETPQMPEEDDFENHADYKKALNTWIKDQVKSGIREFEAKTSQTQQKTQQETKIGEFQSKVAEYKKGVSDYEDVVEDVNDIPLSLTVQELIVESDNGPQMLYELAKDRDKFEKLNRMSPLTAAREFGRIEASLSKSESKETKEAKTTNAPPPVRPNRSRKAGSSKSIYDADLSQADYERLRKAELKARHG